MHDIEPHYHWRNEYAAEHDERSPFYGRNYDEFYFTNKVYNYFIHPQWDAFGSATLYLKILYTDYQEGFAIIELIGEWNDALHNDIMVLKRDFIDHLIEQGVYKYVLICENVLNFHGDDDSYYEEWLDDIREHGGWIALLNVLQHVADEMRDHSLDNYLFFQPPFDDIIWRPQKPQHLLPLVEQIVRVQTHRIAD